MKTGNMLKTVAMIVVIASVTLFAQSGSKKSHKNKAEIDSLKNVITTLTANDKLIEQYLTKFDTLDFVVFSKQQWIRLHETHAKDIKVYWPDGHMTQGLDQHIKDLQSMFVFAPDTRITEHPIKFGNKNFTAVTGVFEGTFTKPMPIGDGKFIQPTGKAVKMPMATIGIWKDGVMVEEHLFWDNQTYMNQLGLGK